MVYPLVRVMSKSVIDAETGEFSFKYFVQFFSQPYYSGTLLHSFKVAISVAVISLLIGIPLAYVYTMYEIKGRKTLQLLIIMERTSCCRKTDQRQIGTSVLWIRHSCDLGG